MSNVSRQIDERDQWLFNASTNDLVGVKNPTGRGEDFLPVRLDSTGASLVSGDGNRIPGQMPGVGVVGDSLLYFGIRPGALVSGATTISGINQTSAYASLDCSVATTGLLEYRAADKSLRFTAPGDSAGAWTAVTSSKRYTLTSATVAMTLEVPVFFDLLPATDSSSVLTLSPNPAYTALLWSNVPTWVEIFSGQRLRFVNACAAGAQLQHLPDLLNDLAVRATAEGVTLTEVWIQAGTNDFASGTTPVLATLQASLTAAIVRARSLGMTPRVLSVPMRSLTASSAAQTGWRDYNRGLPALCKSLGVAFSDPWQAAIDPASATAPKTGMTEDNIHPSGTLSWHAARFMWREMGSAFDAGQAAPFGNTVDAYNVSTNPSGNLLPGTPVGSAGTAGTGGTATDVATTWDVRRNSGSITIVGTKQAALDGGVDWQRLTLGASAAVADEAKYEYNLGVGVTTVAAGDTVEAFVEVSVEAIAGLRRLSIWMTAVGAARNDSSIFDNFTNSATYPALPAVAWTGVIRLPRFKIAASTTSLRFRVFFQTDVGAVPVVDVRRILLRKV